MNKEYEITFKKFYSECYQYYHVSNDIAIEDVRFKKFTDLLDDADIFKNPRCCRYEGFGIRDGKWGLLGYSFTNDKISDDIDIENDDDDDNQVEYEWNFTLFNGFFAEGLDLIYAKKGEIQQAITEVVRFIDLTLAQNSKYILQDYHPIRELQELLRDLHKKEVLSKISYMHYY